MAQASANVKQKQKKQKTKKQKVLKVIGIIAAIIVVIAVVAVIFIHITTLPKKDTDKDVIYVGGMVTSDTVDYQSESAEGIKNNPIIKFMEMVWRFCDGGNKSKHEEQTPPDGITEIEDLAYIDDGNCYHKLDVMYPSDTEKGEKLPVIIDIHGGGWMYADKDLNDYYCMSLADRGYVVFNISYRLVPDVTVNEQIQDVAFALKWVSDNMADYPCDAENVMLTGDSAGGMLAIYSDIIMQSDELREAFGTVDPNINVTALLLTSPVSYMKDGGILSLYTKILWGDDYKEKATYNYMDLDEIVDYAEEIPPVYLITSDGDTMAHKQTLRAYELLKSKGVECTLADYKGDDYSRTLEHVYSVLDPFDKAGSETIDKAIEFYKNTIDKKAVAAQ